MGINYSVGSGNYLNFVPASYGIMNAIHGTSNDLLAIDLDSMVLSGYNTVSYYNHLNNINNTTMSIFSHLQNMTASLQGVQPGYGPGAQSGLRGGTDKQRKEYQEKISFLDGFFEYYKNSSELKALKKRYKEIKEFSGSYGEALEQINEIMSEISSSFSSKLKTFADKRAEQEFNNECKQAKDIATTIKNVIDPASTKIEDGDIELMQQAINEISPDNVLQICHEFNKQNSDSLIKTIQIRFAKAETYNGLKLDNKAKEKLANSADSLIRSLCNTLISKADEYDLDATAKSSLDKLNSDMQKQNLANDADIAADFDSLYSALMTLHAKNIDAGVQDDIDDLFDDADITVNGAEKSFANEKTQNKALANNKKSVDERKKEYVKKEEQSSESNGDDVSWSYVLECAGAGAVIGAGIGVWGFGIAAIPAAIGGALVGAAVGLGEQIFGFRKIED